MRYYLGLTFKMTLRHIIVQICSLLIGPLVFGPILWTNWWGWVLMSCVLIPIYAGLIYSHAWKVAKKESKSYSTHPPRWWHGLVLPASTVVISIIITLLWLGTTIRLFPDYGAQMWYNSVAKSLFYIWNLVFAGLIVEGSDVRWIIYWVLVYGLCPIASLLGYLAGMYNVEIREQYLFPLLYGKQKKKD